jgi:hypothetical protein
VLLVVLQEVLVLILQTRNLSCRCSRSRWSSGRRSSRKNLSRGAAAPVPPGAGEHQGRTGVLPRENIMVVDPKESIYQKICLLLLYCTVFYWNAVHIL